MCGVVLRRVRYLGSDVDDVERLATVMEDVKLLDETIRVANDDYEGVDVDISTVPPEQVEKSVQ